MENLKDKIERFLELDIGNGNGNGNGNGYGNGNGNGYGDGYGNGDGYGYGDGYGNGNCNGNGYGYGYGYGNGYGNGNGDGNGDGYGDGNGDGITEFNGDKVYYIDNVPTIIESVHGSYARGYTIKNNSTLVPCWIARVENSFAHGATLRDAVRDATAKAMQAKPVEERIADTVKKYRISDVVSNKDLFSLHNMLTGSCEFGRKQFCKQHGIDLEGSMTMQEFISITSNDYGGEVIRQLKQAYAQPD